LTLFRPFEDRGPLKEGVGRSDTFFAMYSDTLCSQCGLTLAAIALLAGVVRDMRRSRGDDGTWQIEICPACGEVTGVCDDGEGWAMGHRAPVIQELHRAFVAAQ